MEVPALRGAKSLLLPHSRGSILMPSCCSPHEALSCKSKSPHFAGQTLYCSRGLYSDALVLFSARSTISQVPAFCGENSSLLPHSRGSILMPSCRSPPEVLCILQVPAFRGANSSLLPHSRDSILVPSCCSPHEALSCKSPHFAGQTVFCSRIRGTVF